ncbi:hypothetical protein [Saccharothrix hoggarensis]|uniref:Uncharacterized protein n=1 Tax=Saccharothrix hoggarensis TaxID=913853 RepID=A0ABW3QN55_9PSEU
MNDVLSGQVTSAARVDRVPSSACDGVEPTTATGHPSTGTIPIGCHRAIAVNRRVPSCEYTPTWMKEGSRLTDAVNSGVAGMDRPRCGRPTRTGEACAAAVRQSVALGEFAPACRKHLNPDERRRIDQEPLWSPSEQVHWLLSRAPEAARVLPVYLISARLKIQKPVVAEALRELAAQGRALAVEDNRCHLWGTPERAGQWLADRHNRSRPTNLAATLKATEHLTSPSADRAVADDSGDQTDGDHDDAECQVQPVVGRVERHGVDRGAEPHHEAVEQSAVLGRDAGHETEHADEQEHHAHQGCGKSGRMFDRVPAGHGSP